MELEKFSAEGFRNLNLVEMSLTGGMNVIYGENAQGKTNLLEAVFVLSTLKSFRTNHLPEVLLFGQTSALIQGTVQAGQGKHSLIVSLESDKKLTMLDRKKVDALQYIGVFDVFLFSYPLLEVIRGGPEERRKFLDRSIAMSRPGYLSPLLQYHRAVKQKNALLAGLQSGEITGKEAREEIRSFNQQLIVHGIEVVNQRLSYLNRLQKLLDKRQHLFFEKDLSLSVELQSSFLATQADVERSLERSLDREIARGLCLIGVHRDEISMTINGKELRKYGSSGEHRAFLLLLLLSQLELYEELRGDRPVLLLDDLDSELDQKKIQSFLMEVKDRYQTLIGSSRRELFPRNGNIRVFEIRSGNLLEIQ